MKKYVVFILVLILCLVLFTGCTITLSPSQNGESNSNTLEDRFFRLERTSRWCIYVDRQTNVMYLYRNGGYLGGISVMLDADGKPLLYEGGTQE